MKEFIEKEFDVLKQDGQLLYKNGEIDVTGEDYKYCPECGQLLGEVEEIEEGEAE